MVTARVILDWDAADRRALPSATAARHGLKAKVLGEAGNGYQEVSFVGDALKVYELAIEYCHGDPVEAAWHISDSEKRWENYKATRGTIKP